MNNYYWLTLFIALIEKFDQKSNFQPRFAWAKIGTKRGENMIFQSREWYYIVSMYKLLLMKLVSNLNCEVQPKVKLSALIDLNLYKSREGPNQEENIVFKSLN